MEPEKEKEKWIKHKSSHQNRRREVSSLEMSQLEKKRQEKETGEETK